ncbi:MULTISPECIES: thiol-disulfide oxidoreductase ResA [Robertmurraya]|uniref:Thiol-disulfide oxidoreductase ResA n=1 Tax=Robertmurraya beringensis TaxID=641660 RepID=A0ABV6KKR8_9BACI
MEKKKRYWFRVFILALLFLSVVFVLYMNITKEDMVKVKINESAPNFSLKNLSGSEHNLEELKGKVVLLNFWGSWCKPCKNEMPAIQNVYDKYKNNGFEVLAINIEESEFVVRNYFEQNNLHLPVLLDKQSEVTNLFNVDLLPASFIINREGKVVQIHEGEIQEGQLESWVKSNL